MLGIVKVLMILLAKKSMKVCLVVLPVFLLGQVTFSWFSKEDRTTFAEIEINHWFENNETTTANNGVEDIPHNNKKRKIIIVTNRYNKSTVSWTEDRNMNRNVTNGLPKCSRFGESLVGKLAVNKSVPTLEEIELFWDEKGWLEKGGTWRPKHCQATKVALIVPFRKRYEHLQIFLRHIHPILKRQLLDYRIFIIVQAGKTPFNRAMLFNIGYKESLKFHNFTCFVFHDVDLIPENDKNYYGCPTSPRHLSVAVDKFRYQLPYKTILGGAAAFTREHFTKVNGFSNGFWGWGGEDDDMYHRVSQMNLEISRPSIKTARYQMLDKFHRSADSNPRRHDKLLNSQRRMKLDGLNTLRYKLLRTTEQPLYTMVKVDIKPLPYNFPESNPL